MKAAIPRQAHAIRCLNLKESLSLNRQIERVARLVERALPHVQHVAAQQAKVVHCMPELRVQRILAQECRAKVLALRTVSRCLRVRQVARRSIERLRARHQSRQCCVVPTAHPHTLLFAKKRCI